MLAIYLNDHLLGATAGLELARRARKANEGSELGELLRRLETEIEADRETLRRVMDTLDAGEDKAKVLAGWTAEKLGRMKLNGKLIGHSPLSTVVELEGLSLVVQGNAALWGMLGSLGHPKLAELDFEALQKRAERQSAELESHRIAAGAAAFAAAPAGDAA